MNERMIRFIELLNQMFELDKSDIEDSVSTESSISDVRKSRSSLRKDSQSKSEKP